MEDERRRAERAAELFAEREAEADRRGIGRMGPAFWQERRGMVCGESSEA